MKVLTITTPDVENGCGCRVTLWVSGCNRQCEGCHNSHAWDYNKGTELSSDIVYEKLYNEVNHEYIAGLTISGGDPLAQTDESLKELITFLDKFKTDFPTKNIWIYSGGVYESLIENEYVAEVLKRCDVLVDGPFIMSLHNQDIAFRGSSNQRIIDLKKTTKDNVVELRIE